MKEYIITEQELNGILNYLQQKPFKEVAQGIAVLSQLPEHVKGDSE